MPEPRLLEALQGLPMAGVAAGGWHSVCVSGEWRLFKAPAGLVGSGPSGAGVGRPPAKPVLHRDS